MVRWGCLDDNPFLFGEIMDLFYDKNDVIKKNRILLHAPEHMKEENIIVESFVTGIKKLFLYDEIRTELLEVRCEGWDGEETHRVYNDSEGLGITLEIWKSNE